MELSKAPRLVLFAGCIGTSKLGGGGGAAGGGGGKGIVEVPAEGKNMVKGCNKKLPNGRNNTWDKIAKCAKG